MTFAELEAKMKNLGAQMQAAMQQMQRKLESLPPEQRRQIEQMMGTKSAASKGAAGPLEVQKGGPSRKIAGLPSTRYAVTEGGREVLVVWSTRDVPEFAAMRKDYERFAKTMSVMRSQSGDDTQTRAWTEAMKAADGFPMETESAGFRTTVTKLERRPTAPTEFDPPPGFKKVLAPF